MNGGRRRTTLSLVALTDSQKVIIARSVAVFADVLQGAVFPAFSPGLLSPLNIALDVAVAGILTFLLGWRWYFVPTFLTEMAPMLDLAPTWTIAVFLATGGKPEEVPPAALPGATPPALPPSPPGAPRTLPPAGGEPPR